MNQWTVARLLPVSTVVLLLFQTTAAQPGWGIQISCSGNRIDYGDPFVLTLNLTFQQPQISEHIGKPSHVVEMRELALQVGHRGTGETSAFPFVMPVRFTLLDSKGVRYMANVVVWCDVHKERKKLIKKMIFNEPGTYSLIILGSRKEVSNTLDLEVSASATGQKALSLLATPEDCVFLLGGIYKSPETLSHLEEVVSQCDGTVIGRMAAARLGLEEIKELEQKYPEGEKFLDQYREAKIEEPLVERAQSHLSKAYHLADEFPVRAEVLTGLARTEYVGGDYQKAFKLLDELAEKYPETEDGRKAPRWRQELAELHKRELAQAGQTPLDRWTAFWLVFPIVVLGISGVCLFLALRKKALDRSK